MLRSMYAGISGMKNFQTKLDVIGNNIANVNTTGFKKGRVTFQEMMSQMTAGAQGPTATRGGVNPSQVGLGSQLGSIDNIHTQGFRQTTNNPLDLALEGDGMFVVQSGNYTAYTRAGNFYLDEDGSIVNPQGLYLVGFPYVETNGREFTFVDDDVTVQVQIIDGQAAVRLDYGGMGTDEEGIPVEITVGENGEEIITITLANNDELVITTNVDGTASLSRDGGAGVPGTEFAFTNAGIDNTLVGSLQIPETAQSFSIQTNGTVNYIDADGNTRVAGQIAIASFSNPAGLQKAGNNLYLNSTNAGFNGLVGPETEGAASIVSGSLEMSNVDLAEEFTEMITAQRGFQANTRIITTSDEILQELVNLKR